MMILNWLLNSPRRWKGTEVLLRSHREHENIGWQRLPIVSCQASLIWRSVQYVSDHQMIDRTLAGPQQLPHDLKATASGEGAAEKLVGLPDQRSSRKRPGEAICLSGPSAVKRRPKIFDVWRDSRALSWRTQTNQWTVLILREVGKERRYQGFEILMMLARRIVMILMFELACS